FRFIVGPFGAAIIKPSIVALTDCELLFQNVVVAAQPAEAVKRFAKRVIDKLKLDLAIISDVDAVVTLVVATRQDSCPRVLVDVHIRIEVAASSVGMSSTDLAGHAGV